MEAKYRAVIEENVNKGYARKLTPEDNLVLSTELIMWISHLKEIRKLTFQALALRRSKSRIVSCVWFIYRNMELCYWLVPGNLKNSRIN